MNNSDENKEEKITVDFNPEIGNKQCSRWIKTNLREYVKGDFLFIDTDTVITDKLDEIDDWDIDIGMVYDLNRITPTTFHKKLFEKVYHQALPVGVPYYNSGVSFSPIILDDTEREGEHETVSEIIDILNKRNKDFCWREYSSTKSHTLICSADYRFLTSL